jgi:hypothetical protein
VVYVERLFQKINHNNTEYIMIISESFFSRVQQTSGSKKNMVLKRKKKSGSFCYRSNKIIEPIRVHKKCKMSLNITPQSLRPPRRPVHIVDPFRRVKNLKGKKVSRCHQSSNQDGRCRQKSVVGEGR